MREMRLPARPSRSALMTGMPPATAASNAERHVARFRRRGQRRAVHRQHRLVGGDHRLAGGDRGFGQGARGTVGAADQFDDHVHGRVGGQRHRVFVPAQAGQRHAAVLGAVARRDGGDGDRPAGARGDRGRRCRAAASARRRRRCPGRRPRRRGDGSWAVAVAGRDGAVAHCDETLLWGAVGWGDHSSDRGGTRNLASQALARLARPKDPQHQHVPRGRAATGVLLDCIERTIAAGACAGAVDRRDLVQRHQPGRHLLPGSPVTGSTGVTLLAGPLATACLPTAARPTSPGRPPAPAAAVGRPPL